MNGLRCAIGIGTCWVVMACGSSSSNGGNAGAAGAGANGSGGTGASATGGAPGSAGSGIGGMPVGVQSGDPVVFFTDLVSAPAGAYVTAFGRGFGSQDASSSVTLSGAACRILSWTDGEIEFQLPRPATAGDLVVTTSAGASPPQKLGVHSGKLYFVAQDGNDAWSGTLDSAGGSDGPFATLTRGRDALAAGDVLYVRTGTFTALDNYNAILSLRDVPTGTSALPVALVAYPGEHPVLGDNTLPRSFSLYRGDAGPPLEYLTIAKFTLRPSCDGIEAIGSDHGRFVANEISGATDACENGTVEAQGTSDWKILGNFIHDNGNTKLEHGVYLGGYGSQQNWEIAYNRIGNQTGGRAIQLYGHQPADRIEHVSIHDNEIFEIDRDGIVLGATDADVLTLTDIRIYNNVFHQAGRCVGHGVRIGNDTASAVSVLHNTFYDNGSGGVACDQSTGSPGGQVVVEAAVDVKLENDVFVALGAETTADLQVVPATFTGSNNLYWGGAAPSWDARAVAADPGFAAATSADFHIGSASPAAGKGAAAGVSVDHDGIARPASAPALGAYEPSK